MLYNILSYVVQHIFICCVILKQHMCFGLKILHHDVCCTWDRYTHIYLHTCIHTFILTHIVYIHDIYTNMETSTSSRLLILNTQRYTQSKTLLSALAILFKWGKRGIIELFLSNDNSPFLRVRAISNGHVEDILSQEPFRWLKCGSVVALYFHS